MLNSTPIFFTGSIGLQNGGLTAAIFTRANILSDFITEVPIFTLSFHRNFDEIMNEQYRRGNLKENVKAYNLFIDLDPKQYLPNHPETSNDEHLNEKGFTRFIDRNLAGPGDIGYRYFKNGYYSKYKRFDKNGRIVTIDYFNESWKRTKQEIFDDYGNIIRERVMDVYTNKPRLDRYLSRDGTCYLTVTVNLKTGKNEWFYLHYPQPLEFQNQDDILVYWMNQKLKGYTNPVIMCDKRDHVNIFAKLKGENLRKFFVLHNNHFAYPHVKGSKIDPSCDALFNNLDIFEKVILLTEEHKRDIVEDFGNEEKFIVISHVAYPVEQHKELVIKNHAVSLARYAPAKALHEAIHAFRFVVDEIPTATYSIYGYGELKDELQKLINDLKLQKNVFLKGFTMEQTRNYQEAVCLILTSRYEGFGLVLTESLAAGTPVVSYKTKYGPEEIVRDGIDGFLVEIGDRKGLAEKIIEIMKSDELYQKLSRNGLEVSDRFSYEQHKEKLLQLFV
jgi:glycosyltransferase involved in cell wall biosynthesis